MSFADKVVLVTGGGSGIGAATALAFAKEDACIAIVDRNKGKLEAVTAAYAGCRPPLALHIDITDENQAITAIQRTINEYGKLDILINNAGISRHASILKGNLLKVYDEVMATNLRAVIHLSSLAAPHLIKTKGNIVNISSIGGIIAPIVPGAMPYSITKAGLNHFTIAAALELAPHGVRVNAISPGPVKTDILENSGFTGTWDQYRALTALNRVAEADEIADLVLFLASDKARSVTGSNYVSDNGMMLRK